METKTKVFYSDFGAVGNGIKDDFDALYRAHNYANSLVDYGYTNVTVVAEPGKTYLIGDQGKRTINIKTDTDWTGANFIFNDVEVSNTSAAREFRFSRQFPITRPRRSRVSLLRLKRMLPTSVTHPDIPRLQSFTTKTTAITFVTAQTPITALFSRI